MSKLKMATSHYLCACNELYLDNYMILMLYDNEIYVYIYENVELNYWRFLLKMVDTYNRGGSHGTGGYHGGQERSQGSVCQGGHNRPAEQSVEHRATIKEEVTKALRVVLLTLLNASEESN